MSDTNYVKVSADYVRAKRAFEISTERITKVVLNRFTQIRHALNLAVEAQKAGFLGAEKDLQAIRATRLRSLAAWIAAFCPAGPEPMTQVIAFRHGPLSTKVWQKIVEEKVHGKALDRCNRSII